MKFPTLSVAALFAAAILPVQTPAAAAEALPKLLIQGEDWQEVGAVYGFTDAACNDAAGNFYFSDLKKNTVHKVAPDGTVSAWLENGPSISGLKFGPDGRLYAATQAPKKQVVAINIATKEINVVAGDAQPNDLIVSPQGFVYYTDTGKRRVVGIEIKSGTTFTAATNLNAPNGIALSPDGTILAVSEYRGSNVWTYRIGADGRLSGGAASMTLSTPASTAVSAGDGMTVDASGRYFVTSTLGIQVFEPSGQLAGVIARPQEKGLVSCGFGGPKGEFLYACSSDKIYRRKTQTKAAWLFGGK